MKWIETYKIHLLMVMFALGFFWSLLMWQNSEIENTKLKAEYEVLLNEYATMKNRVEIHIYKYKDVEIGRDTIQPNKIKKQSNNDFKHLDIN